MRKRTLIIGMLFALTLCWCISGHADEDRKSGLFSYRLKGNGTAIITDFDWKENGGEDIYIPQQIDGYTVTEIGEGAFSYHIGLLNYRGGLKNPYDKESSFPESNISVILPETIKVI